MKLLKLLKLKVQQHNGYPDQASGNKVSSDLGFNFLTVIPVVVFNLFGYQAWEGVGVVASARKLIGATNPLQAEPGTIRGDLAVQTGRLNS